MKLQPSLKKIKKTEYMFVQLFVTFFLFFLFSGCIHHDFEDNYDILKQGFLNPPDSARPGVYWYFMDGNLSRQEITNDLESMKKVGIGYVIFLEVNVGIPRGEVEFFSQDWKELFNHAVRESERLGITLIMGLGPGWTGSGGPWVDMSESMHHLVSASIEVTGPSVYSGDLPKPEARRPQLGTRTYTAEMLKQREEYYEDVAVLAFPSPSKDKRIKFIDEKALYYRHGYTARPDKTPAYLPAPSMYPFYGDSSVIKMDQIKDLSAYLQPDGTLNWNIPEGKWTIMRFGKRNNGAVSRPAPLAGLGFECNVFDPKSLDAHYDAYIKKLVDHVGGGEQSSIGGWKYIHMDSWEMGAQNWSKNLREEFIRRRGYDPLPFLPVYSGRIVGSLEMSERFLWDLRKTSSELIVENYAGRVRERANEDGFNLSIEPYAMNPSADLDYGEKADVPMCEFWSKNFGLNGAYSCIEAASIANVHGRQIVAAEAFTSQKHEAWKLYPGAMKNQGDWAFCAGVNRFIYHTFAHKPLGEKFRPGMTMGPWGVHWDRGQTWWPMVAEYHSYITRCQYLLQQGRAVADILYLTPEGAPMVFRPPHSALDGDEFLPDRRGFNFDGCSPNALIEKAEVKNGRIVFPQGGDYSLLVLPVMETMTPRLLDKIITLVNNGAVIMGNPPTKSPSLENFPECDSVVREMAMELWGSLTPPKEIEIREYGKGKIYCGKLLSPDDSGLYPHYNTSYSALEKMGYVQDFESSGPLRYTHRRILGFDVYFISNRSDRLVTTECIFRVGKGIPELWDPLNKEIRLLPDYEQSGEQTYISMEFAPFQSYFVLFNEKSKVYGGEGNEIASNTGNFPSILATEKLHGSWQVSFDTAWGGPKDVLFDELADWTERPEKGIRYYSGIATYRKSFVMPFHSDLKEDERLYIDLGEVKNMAKITLNGMDLGVVWTIPFQVDITEAVRQGNNSLLIEVANLWPNRLIGDEQYPWDGVVDGKWPQWLLEGESRPTKRLTFTPLRFYEKDSELLSSGLLGPVQLKLVKI